MSFLILFVYSHDREGLKSDFVAKPEALKKKTEADIRKKY